MVHSLYSEAINPDRQIATESNAVDRPPLDEIVLSEERAILADEVTMCSTKILADTSVLSKNNLEDVTGLNYSETQVEYLRQLDTQAMTRFWRSNLVELLKTDPSVEESKITFSREAYETTLLRTDDNRTTSEFVEALAQCRILTFGFDLPTSFDNERLYVCPWGPLGRLFREQTGMSSECLCQGKTGTVPEILEHLTEAGGEDEAI